MAGLLSGAIAGAIAGGGEAIQSNAQGQIEQKRRAALEQLRHRNTMARQDDQQDFSRGERVAGQEFQAGRDERLHEFERDNIGMRHDLSMEEQRYVQGQQNYRTNRTIGVREAEGRNDWQLVPTEDGGYAQWSPSRNAWRDADLPPGAQMGSSDLSERETAQLNEWQSKRELIYEQLNGDIPPEPEQQEALSRELETLDAQIGRLIGGSGASGDLEAELDAALGAPSEQGGGQRSGGGQGLLTRGMEGEDPSVEHLVQEERGERARTQELNAAEREATEAQREADRMIEQIRYEQAGNASPGGLMSDINRTRGQGGVSNETLEQAQALAERLRQAGNNDNLTSDQRRWISERLLQLEELGVPINLED